MKWDHRLQVSFPQPRHPLLCREEVARGPVTLLLSPQVPPQALLLAVSTLRARCPGDGPWGPSLFATPGKNGREKKGLPRPVAAGLSPLLTAPPLPRSLLTSACSLPSPVLWPAASASPISSLELPG